MTAQPTDAADPLAHVRAHNPHAGQGAVMLDIGDGVGALVVTTPASMLGEEVDIASDDPAVTAELARAYAHDHGHDHGHAHGHDHGHAHRPHVAALPRPVPGGREVPSLVFPALPAGEYRLYPKGGEEAVMTVAVRDGHVTTASWPA